MIQAKIESILDDFFSRLSNIDQSALLLDYDGTLAPFVVNRREAVPYNGVIQRINKLLQLKNCRLVVISGRSINEIHTLLNSPDNMEIYGLHGAEHRQPDGEVVLPSLSDEEKELFEQIDKWIIDTSLNKFVEKKLTSRAFHWRGEEQSMHVKLSNLIKNHYKNYSDSSLIMLHEFNGGLEIRLSRFDKGKAVQTIINQQPIDSLIAYLGDDNTDEDAFEVMRSEDLAVLVSADERETKALIRINPPEELLDFLDRWIEAIDR